MLIAGAGGLAAQIFEEIILKENNDDIVFWSEVETKYKFITDRYKLLQTDAEVKEYFMNSGNDFIVCVGGIDNRKKVAERFELLGGIAKSYISDNTILSKYITVGRGTLILSRVEIEAGACIGENCLLNKTANVGHGCIIGNNCEIAPGVILTGDVEIGQDSYIGTRAVILPKLKIGKNVVISAGSMVKKNIPDNAVVSGEFASIKFFRKP